MPNLAAIYTVFAALTVGRGQYVLVLNLILLWNRSKTVKWEKNSVNLACLKDIGQYIDLE